jgi:hypothetical protein
MSEGEVVVELWPEKFKTEKEAQAEIDKFCKELIRETKDGYGEDEADDIGKMFDMSWSHDKATMVFDDTEYRTFQIVEEEA